MLEVRSVTITGNPKGAGPRLGKHFGDLPLAQKIAKIVFGAHVATGATLWPRRLKSLLGMGVATFRLVAALLTILGVWINLDTFFYLRSKQGYDAVTDVFGANRPRRPNSQPTIPQSQIQIEPTGLDHKIIFSNITKYFSNIIL